MNSESKGAGGSPNNEIRVNNMSIETPIDVKFG